MMVTRTPTIDSQVHAYEHDRPERPWSGFLQGPDEVTGDNMVTTMDAVGVDGALLVSPFSMYRYDASYALEVYAKHPGRFGLIKPFDPQSEATTDEMAEWTGTPGVVGARIMLTMQSFEADDAGLIWSLLSLSRSSPSRRTSPSTILPGGEGMRRIRERALTVLPHPLSPTRPIVSPALRE